MILITLNGDTQLVESVDGYDGWAVVEKGVDPPPSDHCARVDGAWVEDAAAAAAADEAAALNAMSRTELVAMLQGQIADQAARVDALTVQVDAVAVSPSVVT